MAAEEAMEAGTAISDTETGAALAAVNQAAQSESAQASSAAAESSAEPTNDEALVVPLPAEAAPSVAEDPPPA